MSYSGIILAGGKSVRMGQDKALMEINGIPMIQRITMVLKESCNEIIIASNNEDHHKYGDLGVTDNYADCGPLAGLEAGLTVANNSSCIVLSCDSPFVTTSILNELKVKEDHDAIIADCNGRVHPLIGIYRTSALDTVQSRLKQQQFKMHALLEELDTKYVCFPESMENAFNNINTKEEWEQAIGK